MRQAHQLTARLLFGSSATGSASAKRAHAASLPTFRDATKPGPSYVATTGQVFIIDSDGSTDVVFESPGIAELEAEPTGDAFVRSSAGLTRISGRSAKNVSTAVPRETFGFAMSAEDDVWAVDPNAAHHFDGASWVETPLAALKGKGAIRDVTMDARGAVWLAAGKEGLWAWEGTSWNRNTIVSGNVLNVAPAPSGLFVLVENGWLRLEDAKVSDVFSRTGSEIAAGQIALNGAWSLVLGKSPDPGSFVVGKNGASEWNDSLARLGEDSRWSTVDAGGRAWAAGKRTLTIATHDGANVSVPLSDAVEGQLLSVEVVGTGPEKLPSEIGPSVSIPGPAASGTIARPGASAPLASASAPRAAAALSSAVTSGGSVANAGAVVAGMAAGFRRCYDKGLQEDPNMKGSVRVTAKIGPNGEVQSAVPSGGAGLSQTVVSCVAARVTSAVFSPPDGGAATIVIPVSFFPVAPETSATANPRPP